MLRQAGLRQGQTVLDFGCGHGTYSIPAAQVIEREGKLYALDLDRYELKRLTDMAQSMSLNNITILETAGGELIRLDDDAVDVVLLFDVLHHYYYPREDDRRNLLSELWRVLKTEGVLLFFPAHLQGYMEPGFTQVDSEIADTGFRYEREYDGMQLLHFGSLERGRILSYRKVVPTMQDSMRNRP